MKIDFIVGIIGFSDRNGNSISRVEFSSPIGPLLNRSSTDYVHVNFATRTLALVISRTFDATLYVDLSDEWISSI